MQRIKLLHILLIAFAFQLGSCEGDQALKSKANQTVIILKADDLSNMTPNWQQFIDITIENNIASSIGIISKNMTDHTTINEIKEISHLKNDQGEFVVEFWNHGYDHSGSNNTWEFKNVDLASQIDHIRRAQKFFLDTLGFRSNTFSAPFNQTSQETYTALKSFPEIKVWMCYQKLEKQYHADWRSPFQSVYKANQDHIILDIKIETVYHLPLKEVKKFFNNNKHLPYLIIQVHPNTWDSGDFGDFQALIDFLKERNVIFMTPFQYLNYLTSETN